MKMNAAQDKLIKTYFRKRNIAAAEGYEEYDFRPYELFYSYATLDKHDFGNPYDVTNVLEKEPRLIDKLNLDMLNGYMIANILMKQPQLIREFNLAKLDGGEIAAVLKEQPRLIYDFYRWLYKLMPSDINDVLIRQPQLKSYFNKD